MPDPILEIPDLQPMTVEMMDDSLSNYDDFVQSAANQCDIAGAISTLVKDLTKKVVDEITGAITYVKERASEVLGDIREGLSDTFSEFTEKLNELKGYYDRAMAAIAEIKQKVQQVTEQIVQAVQQLLDEIDRTIQQVTQAINDAVTAVMGAIDDVLDAVADVVGNFKVALCGTITSFLMGAPSDALDNLLDPSSATMLALGATKDAFDSGVETVKDATSKIAESLNIDNIVMGVSDAAKNAVTAIADTAAGVAAAGAAVFNLEQYAETV